MEKSLSLAMLLAFTPACFGSFGLTRKVWGFNKDVSTNKFVQELVYLALVILPVYQLASIGDALIFNTIEFWGGKNPVLSAADLKGDPVAVTRTEQGLRLDVSTGSFQVAIGGDFVEVRDARGGLVRRVAAVDGVAIATEADGRMRALGNLDELWAGCFGGDRGTRLARAP